MQIGCLSLGCVGDLIILKFLVQVQLEALLQQNHDAACRDAGSATFSMGKDGPSYNSTSSSDFLECSFSNGFI
eukprot:m.563669 g.563669  ORF g.563669 m.563669 type:complete len:73 (+) comp22235_c0_seq2:226-444(+)